MKVRLFSSTRKRFDKALNADKEQRSQYCNFAHQFSIVLKQKIRDVGMAVLAGVGEGGVARAGLRVDESSVLQKVFDKIKVTLLQFQFKMKISL